MNELNPGDERVKMVCPECNKQYESQVKYLAADTPTKYVPHYGIAYALVCQDCTDKAIPVVASTEIQAPPTRLDLLRLELVKGFKLMKSGKADQASAEYLFVIANLLLDLAEGEKPGAQSEAAAYMDSVTSPVKVDL